MREVVLRSPARREPRTGDGKRRPTRVYVDESIIRLELDTEVTLLRKPFTPSVLARTVRAALDQHDAAHPGARLS